MRAKLKILSLVLALTILLGAFSGMDAGAVLYRNLDKDLVGLSDEAIAASLITTGNEAFLKNLFRRAEAGEKITVAAIGGSITWGAGTITKGGTADECYIAHVAGWFREKFPNAEVDYVNAGLPSTGSVIGVYRANEDLWQYDPDLLIIEYAVNEGGGRYTDEATETLVRRMYRKGCPACAYFMAKADGWNTQEEKKPISNYYELPMVSYLDGVRRSEQLGGATLSDLDADGTHPNATGQGASGLFLINWLETVYKHYDGKEQDLPALPEPKVSDDLMYVRNLQNYYIPTSYGSFKETDQACKFGQFTNGWMVTDGGTEPIVFEVEAKRVTLVYRAQPSDDGRFLVTVNDTPVGVYSANHTSDEVANSMIFESKTTKKLTVKVRLISGKRMFLSGLWLAY